MPVMSEKMVTAVDKTDFKSRVEQWMHELGVETEDVYIRPMKNKWSSCSDNGRLSFSSSLLTQPEEFQKSVVIRELISLADTQEGRMTRAIHKVFGSLYLRLRHDNTADEYSQLEDEPEMMQQSPADLRFS